MGMSRRPDDVSSVTVPLSEGDRDWFDQMRVTVGCTTDANLIRVALWFYASRQLDLPIGLDVFELRVGHRVSAPNENVMEAKRLRRERRRQRLSA